MPAKPLYPVDTFLGVWAWNTENFNRRIEKKLPHECFTWLGSTGPAGPLFGAQRLDEDTGEYLAQMTQARRILYYEHTGEDLPNRQSVYHMCKNKHCMNPLHLTTERRRKDKNAKNNTES